MQGFGVHTSMWTMKWDRNGAESAIQGAIDYSMDFLEIALLDAPSVDPIHTRNLLEKNEIKAVCSLGLPKPVWPSKNPDDAKKSILNIRWKINKTLKIISLILK